MKPRAWASVVAGVVILIGAAVVAWVTDTTSGVSTGAYERPGRLATLPDRRRLNFHCLGHGTPTVLLESGFGVGAQAWGKVQPRIAAVTRVCAYDRAGYGFSDPGPMPRDGAAIARDLDQGLRAAGIAGPYVVVGHSAGGLYARLFAARRRSDVVGLVFVDSSVEHQTQRMEKLFGAGAGQLDPIRRKPERCLEVTLAPASPVSEPERQDCAKLGGAGRNGGPGLRPEIWRAQLSELDTLFAGTSDQVDRIGNLLWDIPAIVLTAGKSDDPVVAADDPASEAWRGFHRQLAAKFRNGVQRPVRSSHLMMNDRPEVVADAAIDLVRRARKP
jgi:pimeloyl-ACP methyl ester carboxylesterase